MIRLAAGAALLVAHAALAFTLASPAFQDGQPLPKQYTCDGRNISPPLRWSEPPDKTQTMALLVEDPDAPGGTFTHWVLYDLTDETMELREGVPIDGTVAGGAHQGVNDFKKTGWSGPCPPGGKTHHYVFTLYALDGPTGLAAGATKAALQGAMKGHVLGDAKTTATYQR